MTTIQQQFFSLLRSGLWGCKPASDLFGPDTDWAKLFTLSKRQALSAIILDGVMLLPETKRPPKAVYLQWCAVALHVEEQNELLNREIGNLYALLRRHGMNPILAKGQGVAQNYRIPNHRQCGDIDLYIGKKCYDIANKLLLHEGTYISEERFTHSCINWHEVIVENHRALANMNEPFANHRLQRAIAQWENNPSLCPKVRIGNTDVPVPPHAFNMAYLLTHAKHHFFNDGIGLRQVCDWACHLRAHHTDEEKAEAAKYLKDFGLTKSARLFGALLVKYLDFPREDLPIPFVIQDEPKADWLLNDIWLGGNFGHYDTTRKKRPEGYWRGKWYTFVRITKRCTELSTLAPAEAFWNPIMLVYRFAQIQWRKLTHTATNVH